SKGGGIMIPVLSIVVILFFIALFFLTMTSGLFGLVIISEQQVGIVIKKFSRFGDLKPGKLIALSGEAGYQADTLAPGWHFGYWTWQYRIIHAPMTLIPPGEIGLVVAADGEPIPQQNILANTVDCDNFQNARAFLLNGGQKGRQPGILTGGTYR